MSGVIRVLIHPALDAKLYKAVVKVLDEAVLANPDHYDLVVGVPATVDHYGYRDSTRSGVVLTDEYKSTYKRLVIREIDDSVHNSLRDIVVAHITGTDCGCHLNDAGSGHFSACLNAPVLS